MKIYVPEKAKTILGGGGSFTRNLMKALRNDVEFVRDIKDCDIVFIPGSTLIDKETIRWAIDAKKKIVLRIDNIPRNSRNRNTGTGRLYSYSQMADEVIYQSEWAKDFISPFTKKDGVVILNGGDTDIFYPDGAKRLKEGIPQYLYSRYNRDETKAWEMAWYRFQKEYAKEPKSHLWIVGKFSEEQKQYNFDLFGGAEERYTFWGVVENPVEMAQLYRGADYVLVPYYLDACSNVVVEARLCGAEILWESKEGGTAEIMSADLNELTLESMGSKYLEVFTRIYQKK